MAFARSLLAGLAAFALCAASESAPPPALIAAYFKDGRFEPGDYAWARGAFADATPEQRETHRAINAWANDCRERARSEAAAELTTMGIEEPLLEDFYPGTKCAVSLPPFDLQRPFIEFEAALREARPIADTYIAAARLAGQRALGNAASYGEALTARTVEEQMLRLAFNWGREPLVDVPQLSPDASVVLRAPTPNGSRRRWPRKAGRRYPRSARRAPAPPGC